MYVSQAFAEIRHFRKCLGNSGKPGVSSIAWAFPEMPRQLQKWYLIHYIQNLGNGKTQKSIL